MARRKEHNELVAGTLIVVAGLLIVVVLLLLADWRSLTETKKEVLVIFVDQSVKGLDAGGSVEFNGVPIGDVAEVRLDYENPQRIQAVLSVPKDLNLYANASIYVGTGALGGNAWIEIECVGSPMGVRLPSGQYRQCPGVGARPATQPAAASVRFGDAGRLPVVRVPLAGLKNPIYGSERPNAMIADMTKTMGFGEMQRTQLQETIAYVHDSAGNMRDSTADFVAILAEVRTTMMPKVDSSLTHIREIAAGGRTLVETLSTKVPATLDRIDDTVAAVKKLLDDQGPVIADTISKVSRAAGTLDAGTKQQLQNVQTAMTQMNDALARARESMENIRVFTGAARDILVSNRDSLNDMLANFKEGSDQFAAALGEIRREPWRLLRKPEEEQVAASNVLEAARAFAQGASNLRQAATRLSALMHLRGDQLSADDPQYRKLLADLNESATKFDKAEKALYDALKVEP